MGAQFRESNLAAFGDGTVANAGPYVRVKLSTQNTDGSWNCSAAGVNDPGVGVTDNQEIFASGGQVNIWLNNDNKSKIYQCATAIAAATIVFAAAGGQIAQTGTLAVGLSLGAASGAGSNIEVLPLSAVVGLAAGYNIAPSILSGSTDAIPPHVSGDYVLTHAGVDAATLAAPTATTDDGITIRVTSATANAHTITATGLLQTGAAAVNVATFAAHAGASVTLRAYQGAWQVVASTAITFS
jgi:hypothetical protein